MIKELISSYFGFFKQKKITIFELEFFFQRIATPKVVGPNKGAFFFYAGIMFYCMSGLFCFLGSAGAAEGMEYWGC